jgi:signal transduction histidine kinase/DNA-binding response OmpR family regulator/HPt (histidine-containing phosphotransfer) domain-containing protein
MLAYIVKEASMEKNVNSNAEMSQQFIEENKMALELLENISQPCHIWNEKNEFMFCNNASLKLFKVVEKEDFINYFYKFSPECQPDGSLSMESANEKLALAKEKGFVSFDWIHNTIDGEEFPCQITINRMVFHNKVYLLVSIKETQIYDEMMDTIDHHNKLLQKTSEKLEEALESAKRANNAKSDFLANMSHEMRTPLNAIIGLSKLVLEDNKMDIESKDRLEKVYSSGSLLLSLVNDILDISKIEAGKLEILEEEYELASMLNDVIGQNILRIGEKPIGLILNIDENTPAVLYGDCRRVKQVLSNLLSNAFKYTDEGQVTLSLYGEVVDMGQARLIFSVEDTGIGISEENVVMLFEDYTRFNLTNYKRQEGTGLGLSITKRLVNLMNGSINVTSKEGKGSKFVVEISQGMINESVLGKQVVKNLRNFTYTDNKRKELEHFPRIPLPYARVLVVDDNITNLYVIQGMLKPYEMNVDCVTSGQEAVDLIRQEKVRYNAIFMDQMMPIMDGVEATRIIRQEIGSEYAKNINIIAFTANAIYGSEKMFLENGFQAFLSKPVEILALDQIIRQWVRDKEMEQELDIVGEGVKGEEIKEDERKEKKVKGNEGKEKKVKGNESKGKKVKGNKGKIKDEIDYKIKENNSNIKEKMGEYQIEGLNIKKGLNRFGGDIDSYIIVLESYVTNTLQILETIKEVREEDLDEYAIAVHGIKSSSYGIGADKVGEMAESLELVAKAGDLEYVVSSNQEFLSRVGLLITEIDELVMNATQSSVKEKRKTPDSVELKKLYHACKEYDMDGVDQAFSEIERYEYEEDEKLVDWLRENIIRMNFTEIMERLHEKE